MNRRVSIILTTILIAATIAPAASAAATSTTGSAQDVECSFPVTKTDASGHDVTIEEEPQRIVTLNPSAAQTMWEIGGREKVVGVSQFAGFLDGADSREVVTSGFPSTVEVEQVISLNPDLVLAPNTIPSETVTTLRDAGITVYRFAMANSIEDIYQKTEIIGQLTGECSGADSTVTEMRNDVQTVEAAVEGEPKPSVFYDMGDRWTAGPNTFIGGIISKAGGHNIVADASTTAPYPQLSAEFIVEQDPEFLVVSAQPDTLDNPPKSHIPEDSVLRNTTAFEKGNIVVVDTNHISQPAPRIVNPLVKMTKAFHPNAYAEANLGELTDTSGTDKIQPTAYSHTVLSNKSIRLDVTLNYFQNQTATFDVPATFHNERNPKLATVRVTPREPNWKFGVTATTLDTNVTLPGSVNPLVGYRITPHGMWPEDLETLSVTATLNTSQSTRNISAAEITAYTNQSGNWTATPVATTTTNETITMQVNASTYTSMYFAAPKPVNNLQSTIEITPTTTAQPTTANPTAKATTTETGQTATGASPTATETSAATTAATPQPTPNTTGTTIPGFGLLAPILSALLVSLGLYSRHHTSR